jgi:hypothetical protein
MTGIFPRRKIAIVRTKGSLTDPDVTVKNVFMIADRY